MATAGHQESTALQSHATPGALDSPEAVPTVGQMVPPALPHPAQVAAPC